MINDERIEQLDVFRFRCKLCDEQFVSPPNSKGVVEHSWGARAYTGQPLTEAHKARAIADWIAGSKK